MASSSVVRRRWTLGRVVGVLVLLVVVGGVALELFAHYALGLGDPIVVQADPATNYLVAPNQHKRRFYGHVNVNEWSMRSPSFAMPKPPGVYRVLMVGDSMTWGTTTVDDSKIFTSLLRAELPAELHRPVEILTAATGAWAIANELGYVQSRGTFDSDLVVLVINTGDTAQAPAVLSDVGGDAATKPYPCALCEVWTRYIVPDVLHIRSKQDAGTTVQATRGTDEENARANINRLTQFQQVVQAHGARMAILFLAMRAFVEPGQKVGVHPAIAAWAEQHHVPLLDVTDAESVHPTKDITIDGLHFNVAGNRVVATAAEQRWAQLDPGLGK